MEDFHRQQSKRNEAPENGGRWSCWSCWGSSRSSLPLVFSRQRLPHPQQRRSGTEEEENEQSHILTFCCLRGICFSLWLSWWIITSPVRYSYVVCDSWVSAAAIWLASLGNSLTSGWCVTGSMKLWNWIHGVRPMCFLANFAQIIWLNLCFLKESVCDLYVGNFLAVISHVLVVQKTQVGRIFAIPG